MEKLRRGWRERQLLELAGDAPRGSGLPGFELVQRPLIGLIGVAGGAGIWDFELFGRARRNKLEGVRANHIVS